MAPNRIRRRTSSNPATGHQGLPRRHGHRTLPELAQVPRIWPARRSLDTRGGHPSSYFVTRPSNGMAGSTMPTCAYRHACHCSIISLTLRNRPWTGLSARIAAVVIYSGVFAVAAVATAVVSVRRLARRPSLRAPQARVSGLQPGLRGHSLTIGRFWDGRRPSPTAIAAKPPTIRHDLREFSRTEGCSQRTRRISSLHDQDPGEFATCECHVRRALTTRGTARLRNGASPGRREYHPWPA